MKKFIAGLFFNILFSMANAQNGLEQIIVEKYYISDAYDSIASDDISANPGTLPVGSTTYRIYVDMLPGYNFQAVYGVPGHEWKIETSTLFYNNEDRGATSPTYSKAQAKNNTVMLDSWLTVGAACAGNAGVLKTADDGVATVANADGVLQNNNPDAGIPISVEDGMIGGTPGQVTAVGITAEIAMFDALNDGTNGPLFSTSNGSLACLGGTMGPDAATNQVLVAQITTNGVFSFELNIQIGTPSGGVENYVARDAVGNEIVIPSLIYPNTVAVNEIKTSSASFVSVFPNPANDFVAMNVNSCKQNSLCSYHLYDVTGRSIFQKTLAVNSPKFSDRIDLSAFEKGIYFLEVTVGENTSVQKITKN